MTLRAEGLRVDRRGRRVLDDVSLSFETGRVTALIGPNGAGKSTLLQCLAGLLAPTRGRTLLGELDVRSAPATVLARRRAFVAQKSELNQPFSVREVVGLGRFAAEGRAHEAAVDGSLARLGLMELQGRSYAALSGGEQQRVHLARALAQLHGATPETTALLLDEPTASLDLAHAVDFVALCRAEAARGVTVVVVVHDLVLAQAVADDAVLLSGGRLVAAGPARAVIEPGHLARLYSVPFPDAAAGQPWHPIALPFIRSLP